MLIKEMVNDRSHWIKPFIQQVRQIHYFVQYSDEVMSDFLFIANKEINPDADDFGGMSSRQFFALIKQLPGYDGAVRRRFIREQELEKKRQQRRFEGLKKPNGQLDWLALAAKAKQSGSRLEMGSNPEDVKEVAQNAA